MMIRDCSWGAIVIGDQLVGTMKDGELVIEEDG